MYKAVGYGRACNLNPKLVGFLSRARRSGNPVDALDRSRLKNDKKEILSVSHSR